jgi:hypothetical protein
MKNKFVTVLLVLSIGSLNAQKMINTSIEEQFKNPPLNSELFILFKVLVVQDILTLQAC